jgi:antitoxin component YwqK of YwqJK toxin-antitoxin module
MKQIITLEVLKKYNAPDSIFNYFIKTYGEEGAVAVCDFFKGEEEGASSFPHEDFREAIGWLFETFKVSGICGGYYENGQMEFRDNYRDGKKHGLCTWYYEKWWYKV